MRWAKPTGGRRSPTGGAIGMKCRRTEVWTIPHSAIRPSRPCGPRCRPEVGVPSRPRAFSLARVQVVEAAGIEPASESLLQRRLHAYPGCGWEPAPGGAFPSFSPAPHQPGESRLRTYPLYSPTAREDRRQSPPSRRPFPPGRRGQEERGYLSSQCQFSVGFCFVSTVYERWTPDMQSLLHVPSSNPVRPLLARFRRQVRS